MFHLNSKQTVLNKAEVGDYTEDVWALRANLLMGFMIITPSIKSPLTKFLTLCADAGASICEEKVKKDSWHVAGCCSCFFMTITP